MPQLCKMDVSYETYRNELCPSCWGVTLNRCGCPTRMCACQTLRSNRGHDCELDGHVYMSDQVCNGEPGKGSICAECEAIHG